MTRKHNQIICVPEKLSGTIWHCVAGWFIQMYLLHFLIPENIKRTLRCISNISNSQVNTGFNKKVKEVSDPHLALSSLILSLFHL